MAIPRAFLSLFKDSAPGLVLDSRFVRGTSFGTIRVNHILGKRPTSMARREWSKVARGKSLSEMQEFYSRHDGAQLCLYPNPQINYDVPLFNILSTERLIPLTARFRRGGDYGEMLDLNPKHRAFYRSKDPWIAFAHCGSWACLTTFLSGPNAGKVFYYTVQPQFNIFRPIAASFNELLYRISTDVAAFLRLCRCHVTVVTKDSHFQYVGLSINSYVPNTTRHPAFRKDRNQTKK